MNRSTRKTRRSFADRLLAAAEVARDVRAEYRDLRDGSPDASNSLGTVAHVADAVARVRRNERSA